MIRRFGNRPETGRKYTLRHGVYGVLLAPDGVLVTQQDEPLPELQLPGGGIDPQESVLAALHREVIEETGWRIAPQRRLGVYRRFTYMPDYDLWAQKICHIYLARPVRKLGPPTEPGHSAEWLTQDQALEHLTNTGDRYFLARALRLCASRR